MPYIADTHVHLYDLYDPGRFFTAALDHLAALGQPGDLPTLLLTEAAGCHAFARLRDGHLPLPPTLRLTPTADPEALHIQTDTRQGLLIAGRQIVTRERLELLALATHHTPEDGLPAAEVLRDLHAHHAIPVLPWAPGKWMFRRAPLVHDLCRDFPEILSLGDTRMRPRGWPTPPPMRRARLPLLAGSDPLPVPGEETQCGQYATRLPGPADPDHPIASLRRALRDPALARVGTRNTPTEALQRFLAHHRAKQAAS